MVRGTADGLRLPPWLRKGSGVFNIGQRTAVEGAFRLAGYIGPLVTAPVTSEDERAFLLEPAALGRPQDDRTLEQIVQQLLGRKVFVVERSNAWGSSNAWGTPEVAEGGRDACDLEPAAS